MEIDINSIVAIVLQITNAFLSSSFFWWIKFILAIYVVVLFVDMVLLLATRGLSGDLRNTVMGAQMPLASKKKMQKRWIQIEDRLESDNVSQFKAAILEADKIADEVLLSIGYGGKNMKERLEIADSRQIEEIDNLIEGHAIRNKIIYEDNFKIDKNEAQRVINLYREFLENLEII